jgi:hypothetical protein
VTATFDLEVCRRLPLADAALRLLDFLTEDDFLQGVFDRHRGHAYQGVIAFPLFVRLVADALLGHRGPSAHQAFRAARAEQTLPATVQAMYGKLRRIPLRLSRGFFAEAAARLRQLDTPAAADPLPAALDGFWALGFDGKKLKYVAKRLKALRGLKGHVFDGKLLVVQDLRSRRAVAAEAVLDGEAGDNPLVPPALAQVRALPEPAPRLWLGDAAFCTFALLGLLSADGDAFVVRFNHSCGFHPDPDEPAGAGTDERGRPYREEWGWLGGPDHPRRLRVRKISVASAESGPLVLVTSLLDADAYPAADLLEAYARRWGLEVMFQQVVQTFDLRHLIGGSARATVFQGMLCLLLYNVTLVIRDYVAAGAGAQPEAVSVGLLFDAVVRDLTGWMEVLGPAATPALLTATRPVGVEALGLYLREVLGAVDAERWLKAPPRERPRPPRAAPRGYICGGHSSVEKILRGEHKVIPLQRSAGQPPPHETPKDV